MMPASSSTFRCIFRMVRAKTNVTPATTSDARQTSPTATVTTIRKTSLDMRGCCPCDQLARETFRRRPADSVAISLASGFHGIGDAVLLAAEGVLALFHPVGGGLLDVGAALFYKVRAFAGLVFDDLASFRSGLRRKQHSDAHTHAES